MMGPEFLLKQMGVDPDEIKKRFIEGRDMVAAAAKDMKDTLGRIEAKQDAILARLDQQHAAPATKRLQIVKGAKRKHG